jgi:AcrR family transcriptional regulator
MTTATSGSVRTQARSHVTREAILDAAEKLFGENGVRQTAVTEVARVAKRSIGSLYHQFDDKAALVAAVVDRIADHLESAIATAGDSDQWIGRPITDIVAGYVTGSLAVERARPGYKRIINEASHTDPNTRDRYRRIRSQASRALSALLLERRDEIAHPDPDTAVRFVVDQLTAMLVARLDSTMTPSELEGHTDEQFLDACIDSTSAYLRLSAGSRFEDQKGEAR